MRKAFTCIFAKFSVPLVYLAGYSSVVSANTSPTIQSPGDTCYGCYGEAPDNDGSPNLGNAMHYKLGTLINSDQQVSGYANLDYDCGSSGDHYSAYGADVGLMFSF